MNSAHVHTLETRHAGLDRRISDETHRPLPNTVLIAALKKQKLKIKEALSLS
ncbi:MAG: YdcH family protein [Sphingomonadaceae bacterium]